MPDLSEILTAEPPVHASPVRRRSWLKRVLWAIALLALAATLCWTFRAPLLTGVANAWIVNNPIHKADAIYVLGGGLETRPFEAARLYREGFAPRILISSTESSRSQKIGIQPAEKDLVRSVLLKEGVPETAITAIGDGNASTRDEALALEAWAGKNNAKAIIIPTDLFHTHRVAWFFKKALHPMNVVILVTACEPAEYSAKDWWQHEGGLITFQNEVIKNLYYHLKY